ncbi:regulatory protein RecX [Gulosibacter sp. ACHW.36C]|uniref:Regulatory protein RecX n=1 Tax=Gulosibacter sediminis TaxID=1729695 RepID=A0ABY4MUI2_9MICO|nr:regulatory protein RecX [Gulosibacter sediminis]UQN14072.1 RecX family transcriptional regulator [Gulosibacter sediminis]
MTNDPNRGDDGLAPVIAFPGRPAAAADAAPEGAGGGLSEADKATQLDRLRARITSVEQGASEQAAELGDAPRSNVTALPSASLSQQAVSPDSAPSQPAPWGARQSAKSAGPRFAPTDDDDAQPAGGDEVRRGTQTGAGAWARGRGGKRVGFSNAEPDEGAETTPPLTGEEAIEDGVQRLTRVLARSPKSAQECDAHLQINTELDEAQRGEVLDRLRGYGYLDDERLAEQLVTGKLARKGLGRAGMARELRQRGLDSDIIDDALESSDSSEFDLALELATKRARSLSDLDPEVARRRLYGYLGRRGFSGSVVSQVVHLALQPPKSSGPHFK